MAGRKTNGRGETMGYEADVSDSELEDRRAKAKLGTTAGADLGGLAAKVKADREKVRSEETDPDKMSPLARAAYLAKKRKGSATAGDAASALASR